MATTFDYAKSRKTADGLIRKFAALRKAWLIAKNQSGGDEWNPTFGAPTITAVQAVEIFAEKSQVDGTRIETDARVVLISAEGLAVAVDTTLQLNLDGALVSGEIVGGTTMEIIKVKPLDPAGTVVFYEVQAK